MHWNLLFKFQLFENEKTGEKSIRMNKSGRFKNSLRNSTVAFAGQISNILFGFVLRSIFIYKLGQEYLGVNGVMESMLSLLSMTELGIGTSVAFALYKPVNDDNKEQIGRLMAFYRRTYHVIGIITLVLGLLLIPFMNFFTKEASDVSHINLIYIIFLANTVLSYFFSYKNTLLSAYQRRYVTSLCEDIACFVKYILQAVVLLAFGSYIGYLIVHMLCVLGGNIAITVICNRDYGFIKQYKNQTLTREEKKGLRTSVVSLMYQKIGAKLVMGTDNLMISYAGIALMGVYSNYSMVVSTINRIIYNVTLAVMGSVGNLLVQKENNHKYKVYEEIVFAEFCFYFIVSVGFAGCLERFIQLWAGDSWLLSPTVTFVVILNFYLMGMRQPNVLIIETDGLFNKMRAKAVLEVVVNLVVSFIFLVVLDLGIYGVLFGTTVSMASVCIWWEIGAVHKYTFKASAFRYYINYLCYGALTCVCCFLAYFVNKALPIYGLFGLLVSGVISVFIAFFAVIVFYGNTDRFKSLLKRLKK